MTTLDWTAVRRRYDRGANVPPLAGVSTLTVVHIDDDQICVAQRLWRACVTREQLETAVTLLDEVDGPISAVAFSERLRAHYAEGPQISTDCSRTPNLSAVLLKDLGYLVH